MAYTTIDDSSAHFQATIYTGEGNGTVVTNDGNSDLQPDLVWFKRRGGLGYHQVLDSTRGVTKRLWTNDDGVEGTQNQLASFDSNGFTCGSSTDLAPADTCVAWQCKANGGTTSTNTAGSMSETVTVQANTTAGFSIITYTGSGTSGNTVGHGMGAIAELVITKARVDVAEDGWQVYHEAIGPGNKLVLDTTAAYTSTSNWASTRPTSTVITVNASDGGNNEDGDTFVAYCFAPIQGFSKFGSYKGTGNEFGPFVYLGFKPAFLMVKGYAGTDDWIMMDNKRSGYNPENEYLDANNNTAESDVTNVIDFLSYCFKLKSTFSSLNYATGEYIYAAFAENPFVTSTGIPGMAR